MKNTPKLIPFTLPMLLVLVVAAQLGTGIPAHAQRPASIPAFQTQGGFWAIVVADLDASEHWYVENLGLQRVKIGTAPNGKSETVVLAGHGIFVEIVHFFEDKHPQAQAGPKDGQRLQLGIFKTGVTVSPQDFDGLLQYLQQRKAEFIGRVFNDDEMGVRSFIVRDNTGNLVQFFAKK